MAQQPQKKIKRFAPKKGGAATAQGSKKRSQVKKKAVAPPIPAAQPVPPPIQPPVATPPPAVPAQQVYAPPPGVPQQVVQPVQQPVPQQVPQPVQQQPSTTLPPTAVPVAPMQPVTPPMAQQPPIQPMATPPLNSVPEPISMPTQINVPAAPPVGQRTGSFDKKPQKKVLRGKPAVQTDFEDLKDEVASYLEVCDSCLSDHTDTQDIVDVVHMLVRSLNMDVLTIALLDEKKENLIEQIASRGYKTAPTKTVIACWEKAIIKGDGLDWKRLMKVAGNTQTELAYWIIHEGLDSIGYVPIRDNKTIYGFLFVAAKESKKQSPLTSPLLDACGSRLGMMTAQKYNKGDWPQSILNLGTDIRNQFSLIMGYFEMLKEGQSMPPENYNALLEHCNNSIMESTQILDSMTTEAGIN